MPIDHRHFPNLAATGFQITSAPDPIYNCIAWAAGITDAWWWPDPAGYDYWPSGVVRAERRDAFIQAFATIGYFPCSDSSFEPGFDKVALYEQNGIPTHAARQLPNGRWTSKLGPEDDTEHELDGLTGPLYGVVVQVLRRQSTC